MNIFGACPALMSALTWGLSLQLSRLGLPFLSRSIQGRGHHPCPPCAQAHPQLSFRASPFELRARRVTCCGEGHVSNWGTNSSLKSVGEAGSFTPPLCHGRGNTSNLSCWQMRHLEQRSCPWILSRGHCRLANSQDRHPGEASLSCHPQTQR